MPAVPGESLLTTLFADVHYYFDEPAVKPQHHRFDRGSYVYIYHNPASQQVKVEVANQAGTPEQDAFSGYFGPVSAKVQYSYKQPTLFHLLVPSESITDTTQWHLPAYDPHNEQKYLYPIVQLDIYLWTEKDAATFLRHMKAILPAHHLTLLDVPVDVALDEHRLSMSPVVQQLEKTAIGSQFPPRAESTVSHQSFPGPPTPATSGGAISPPIASPAPYNPSAPAAPEPISHREKTPPPPDDGSGTGLTAAAKYDHVPLTQSFPQQQPQTYFSGPPQQQASFPSAFAAPPPPPQGPQHNLSFPGPPSTNHTPQPPTSSPYQQPYQAQQRPTTTAQYANYPSAHSQSFGLPPTPSAPPAYHGHTPLQSPGLPGPPGSAPMHLQGQYGHYIGAPSTQQYAAHAQSASQGIQYGHMQHPAAQTSPAPQGFQYGNYDYSAAQTGAGSNLNTHGAYTGDMHSQVYRPTAAEAAHGHGGGSSHAAPKNEKAGLEQRFNAVDKKFGGFMKKLDKYI